MNYKMKETPWIKFNGTIGVKKGITQSIEDINFLVFIKDGYAVLSFPKKHKSILKKLVKAESKEGYNIKYYEDKNIAIEKFPGLTAQMIATKIGKEMKQTGGTLV